MKLGLIKYFAKSQKRAITSELPRVSKNMNINDLESMQERLLNGFALASWEYLINSL